MHWLSGTVLALGLALATGAAAGCPRDHDGRERPVVDARRYDPPTPPERYGAWSERAYGSQARDNSERYPPRYDDAYPESGDDWREDRAYEDRYGPAPAPAAYGASPWYRDGRRPQPLCPCPDRAAWGGAAGGVRLSSGFFSDAGGVGPIPSGGDGYGGRYAIMGGGSSVSRAYSSAQASSSATVIIRRGGFSGGHGGKHGGKGH